MIDKLSLTNFTVFDECEIDFSSRVNVIVGENGTGKTHLLKTAYSIASWDKDVDRKVNNKKKDLGDSFCSSLLRVFFQKDRRFLDLRKRNSKGKTMIRATFADGSESEFTFGQSSKSISTDSELRKEYQQPIMIPAKEVLSFLDGISAESSDHATIESLFDNSYLDLCNQLLSDAKKPKSKELELNPRIGTLMPALCKAIGGQFTLKDSRLILTPGVYKQKRSARTVARATTDEENDKEKLESVLPQLGDTVDTVFVRTKESSLQGIMTAEGHKKIGVLQQLLLNGSLLPGTSGPLFWDEPEANVNPVLMRLMVEIILELSRNGQQVILATHDYVLLKWLDFLEDKSKSDDVRYHSLYRDNEGKVRVETCDEYRLLNQNAISDSFAELYDYEVSRALRAGK